MEKGKKIRLIDADVLSEKILDVVRCVIPESEFTEGYTSGLYAVTKQIEDEPTIEQPAWISCAERLPDVDTDVICRSNLWGNDIFIGFIGHKSGAWMDGGIMHIGEVTHWMPLPQPPKGDE